MTVLNDLEIGTKFILNGELYEKIIPIRKSCCSSYTAKKIVDDTNTVIKPNVVIELPVSDE